MNGWHPSKNQGDNSFPSNRFRNPHYPSSVPEPTYISNIPSTNSPHSAYLSGHTKFSTQDHAIELNSNLLDGEEVKSYQTPPPPVTWCPPNSIVGNYQASMNFRTGGLMTTPPYNSKTNQGHISSIPEIKMSHLETSRTPQSYYEFPPAAPQPPHVYRNFSNNYQSGVQSTSHLVPLAETVRISSLQQGDTRSTVQSSTEILHPSFPSELRSLAPPHHQEHYQHLPISDHQFNEKLRRREVCSSSSPYPSGASSPPPAFHFQDKSSSNAAIAEGNQVAHLEQPRGIGFEHFQQTLPQSPFSSTQQSFVKHESGYPSYYPSPSAALKSCSPKMQHSSGTASIHSRIGNTNPSYFTSNQQPSDHGPQMLLNQDLVNQHVELSSEHHFSNAQLLSRSSSEEEQPVSKRKQQETLLPDSGYYSPPLADSLLPLEHHNQEDGLWVQGVLPMRHVVDSLSYSEMTSGKNFLLHNEEMTISQMPTNFEPPVSPSEWIMNSSSDLPSVEQGYSNDGVDSGVGSIRKSRFMTSDDQASRAYGEHEEAPKNSFSTEINRVQLEQNHASHEAEQLDSSVSSGTQGQSGAAFYSEDRATPEELKSESVLENVSLGWSINNRSVNRSTRMMSEEVQDKKLQGEEFNASKYSNRILNIGEAMAIQEGSEGDDLNLPWTTKSEFPTILRNADPVTTPNYIVVPATSPEGSQTSLLEPTSIYSSQTAKTSPYETSLPSSQEVLFEEHSASRIPPSVVGSASSSAQIAAGMPELAGSNVPITITGNCMSSCTNLSGIPWEEHPQHSPGQRAAFQVGLPAITMNPKSKAVHTTEVSVVPPVFKTANLLDLYSSSTSYEQVGNSATQHWEESRYVPLPSQQAEPLYARSEQESQFPSKPKLQQPRTEAQAQFNPQNDQKDEPQSSAGGMIDMQSSPFDVKSPRVRQFLEISSDTQKKEDNKEPTEMLNSQHRIETAHNLPGQPLMMGSNTIDKSDDTTKPSSSPYLTFKNPFPSGSSSNANDSSRLKEPRQMKEMTFYSGSHPALRGRNAGSGGSNNTQILSPSILPPSRQPMIPLTHNKDVPSHQSSRPTMLPQNYYLSADSLPIHSNSAEKYSEKLPSPVPLKNSQDSSAQQKQELQASKKQSCHPSKPPGQYTEIAVGLQGRAFAYDTQGQPVDLPVILATARSLLCNNEQGQMTARDQPCITILEGLRGHHGPLFDVPLDHINRLLDFYIEQKFHSLVATSGEDKDVLLWILLKRIFLSHRLPHLMEATDVQAFLCDCAQFSDHLNLVDDQLPALKSELSSGLPSSLPLKPPRLNLAARPSSTAWADCCRRICSGQALEAVEFALSFGMWGHAFSTALLVSPMCFNAVRVEYASSLNFFGQPRKSQYWIKQADGPPPQFSGLYEPLHLDCVKTLYVLNAIPAAVHPQDILEAEQKLAELLHGTADLSTTWLTRLRIHVFYLGLAHPNCRLWLRALGKELVKRKEVAIGHCCLILSGAMPLKDFGLLGCATPLDEYQYVLQDQERLVDFDWKHFQLTEFFDRIIANLADSNTSRADLEIPKFLYSRILRIAGFHKMVGAVALEIVIKMIIGDMVENLKRMYLQQADAYLTHVKPKPDSLLRAVIETESPTLQHSQFKHSKQEQDTVGGSRLGNGFGIRTLIRNFLNQDE